MSIEIEYPEIYNLSNNVSAAAQRNYLTLILAEFFLLAVASLLSLDFYDSPVYFISYALVLLLALTSLIYRSTSKPEQRWYRARALTESIKTTAWRYAMRAEPYLDASEIVTPRREYMTALQLIFKNNKDVLGSVPSVKEARTTGSMDQIRLLPTSERISFYRSNRIEEQRSWYSMKSRKNRRSATRWLAISVLVYVFAVISVLIRISEPTLNHSPTELFIVLASSALGWIQVKKFNELASAYSLTSTEISFLLARMDEVLAESTFSEFVNEAELAFSREHTQWVARLNEA